MLPALPWNSFPQNLNIAVHDNDTGAFSWKQFLGAVGWWVMDGTHHARWFEKKAWLKKSFSYRYGVSWMKQLFVLPFLKLKYQVSMNRDSESTKDSSIFPKHLHIFIRQFHHCFVEKVGLARWGLKSWDAATRNSRHCWKDNSSWRPLEIICLKKWGSRQQQSFDIKKKRWSKNWESETETPQKSWWVDVKEWKCNGSFCKNHDVGMGHSFFFGLKHCHRFHSGPFNSQRIISQQARV